MVAKEMVLTNKEDYFDEIDQIIRVNSKTFYFATNLLPKNERRAVRALYAFCRRTDDLVDEEQAGLDDVEDWRRAVNRPAIQQDDPLLMCWAETREQYHIDAVYQNELIDGVCQDLKKQEYQTWEELEYYCYLVASTVGLLSTPIIGLAKGADFETAKPYAVKLGIALQLTNILRDVGEDAENGRVYLPQEDLALFGLTRADILHKVYDQRFIALMQFEIHRARQLFMEALPGIAMLSRKARASVGVAALLYRAILDEIEAIHYQTHLKRAFVSGKKKLAYLPRFLWQSFTIKADDSCLQC